MRRTIEAVAMFSLLALLPVSSFARPTVAQKKQMAMAQFEAASRLRAQLEDKPENERSRHAYQRVIEAYHKVVVIAPSCAKAGASVFAEAEMRQQAGAVLGDEDLSHSALERYKFLLHEYPDVQRAQAEFNIAVIQKDDLGQVTEAKASFEEFIRKHPQHRLTPDAQAALNQIEHPRKAAAKDKSAAKKAPAEPVKPGPAKKDVKAEAKPEKPTPAPTEIEEPAPTEKPYGSLPRVTAIRYWSLPDSTRVAIELESEVRFVSGRIPSPERIFFDLSDTRIAPELMGKSVLVDDGYVRKIRIGQFQHGLTRVVLEVDPAAEYTASFQGHPARLLVDVRTKPPANAVVAKSAPPPVLKPHDERPVLKEPAATRSQPPAPAASKESVTAKTTAPVHSPESTSKTTSSEKPAETKHTEAKPADTKGADVKSARVEDAVVKPAPHADTKSHPAETKIAATAEVASTKLPQPPLEEKARSTAPEDKKGSLKDTKELADGKTSAKPGSKPPSKSKASDALAISREAAPDSDGQRSLTRALGLKIGKIVVDAGHGGHDTGTVGPKGLEEKDLVLDVALRLGKLLQQHLGADVVYTREDDVFVPLESRTALANESRADLFISIHANSSRDRGARGVETYYLNFTSSEEALELASRENATSDLSIHELQDLVKKIALKDKVEESREFAGDVQHAMYAGLSVKGSKMRDRGVKKAPFVVLIGANMPSILAEISFVSNPSEEKRLQTAQWRQKIAESLYRGIARYAENLSGVKVADKGNKTVGQ